MWNTAVIFSNKNHRHHKKALDKNSFYTVDYVKIIEVHTVHIWRHIQS